MQGLLGILLIVGACWLLSEARRLVRWRLVGVGLLVQFSLGYVLLKVPFVADSLGLLNHFGGRCGKRHSCRHYIFVRVLRRR